MPITYKKHPSIWWEDETIHKWFKAEKKKLSAEAKKMFEKRYGKKSKSKKDED